MVFENWFSEVTFLQENIFLFNFMMKFQNEAFSWELYLEIIETKQFSLLLLDWFFFDFPNFKQLPPSIAAQQEDAELLRNRALEMNHFLTICQAHPFPISSFKENRRRVLK